MDILSRNGGQFRSKTMDESAAFRFARCLRANERFHGVMVNPSKSAGQAFVTFTSASDPSGERILARQQALRDARGAEQADSYLVAADPSGRFHWVCNLGSGEVYEVALHHDCTCPDHVYRCRPAGCLCKHHAVVEAHLGRGTVTGFPTVPAVNERRAQALRDRELWD
ncbi:MAG: hypothetical protein ACK47B_11080 [Armatimonadota bacterium]